jgi:hypothetical protein
VAGISSRPEIGRARNDKLTARSAGKVARAIGQRSTSELLRNGGPVIDPLARRFGWSYAGPERKETAGDRAFFRRLLHEAFVFLRASGDVDDKKWFLEKLKKSEERDTSVESMQIYENRAVVTAVVAMTSARNRPRRARPLCGLYGPAAQPTGFLRTDAERAVYPQSSQWK